MIDRNVVRPLAPTTVLGEVVLDRVDDSTMSSRDTRRTPVFVVVRSGRDFGAANTARHVFAAARRTSSPQTTVCDSAVQADRPQGSMKPPRRNSAAIRCPTASAVWVSYWEDVTRIMSVNFK